MNHLQRINSLDKGDLFYILTILFDQSILNFGFHEYELMSVRLHLR